MIEFQRKLLGDRLRNDAFAKALKKVIVPGKTVVADIGSGTGFLSFLAAKLGARECFLYESGEILEVSKELAKENGIRNCRFIRKTSWDVHDPVQADVVVSETLGNYALEENIIETMNDARRFLKPKGVMLPQKLRQYVCPVVTDRLWKDVNVWDGIGFDLRFAAAKEIGLCNMYVKTVRPGDLLPGKDAAREWDDIDFRKKEPSVRSASLEWKMPGDTRISGFALWWECDLLPGIAVSTSPHAPPTHWEQIYLPVLEPLELSRGDTVTLKLKSDTRPEVGVNMQWDVAAKTKAGVVRQSLDMRRGYLE